MSANASISQRHAPLDFAPMRYGPQLGRADDAIERPDLEARCTL